MSSLDKEASLKACQNFILFFLNFSSKFFKNKIDDNRPM
jgi:hypothetical protein